MVDRHRLIRAGFTAIDRLRLDRLLAPVARGRGLILTLHHVRPASNKRFQPNRLLEISPAFLERVLALLEEAGVAIIPLGTVPEALQSANSPPFAAITFDDGYRDNWVHAAPILRRRRAPWTMFVTTGFADGTARLWWLELEDAVGALDMIDPVRTGLAMFGLGPAPLPARDAREKQAAFATIYAALRARPEPELREAIAALSAAAGLAVGTHAARLCLSFDELRAIGQDPDIAFGAHTATHPMLAQHPESTLQAELVDARARLEAELGRPVRHLAYPVGDPGSAGPREFAAARAAGYELAVTTRPGHLFAEHARHLHALPRVSLNGLFQDEVSLRAMLSGVPFLAWNRGRRLNVA